LDTETGGGVGGEGYAISRGELRLDTVKGLENVEVKGDSSVDENVEMIGGMLERGGGDDAEKMGVALLEEPNRLNVESLGK
jgi:hypothetical protein